MKMKMKYSLLALAFVCSPAAFAGDLGTSSTDTTDVSVSIGNLVQLTVEGNIGMGAATLATDSTGSTGLCIYRNGAGSVNLTLTSSNPSASDGFQMANGNGDLLGYSLDLSGADTVSDFASGTAASLANPDNTSSSCSGSYPHSLDATVLAADQDAAQAGNYSDTVTLLVAPI